MTSINDLTGDIIPVIGAKDFITRDIFLTTNSRGMITRDTILVINVGGSITKATSISNLVTEHTISAISFGSDQFDH